jgi:membrane protease YdiL (CAAX protease family)
MLPRVEFQSPSERISQWLREQDLRRSARRLSRQLRLAHPAHWLILAAMIALLASSALPVWTWSEPDSDMARFFGNGSVIWAASATWADAARRFVTTLGFMATLYLAFSPIPQLFRKFIQWTAVPIVLSLVLETILRSIAVNPQERSVLAPLADSWGGLALPGDAGSGLIVTAVALATLGTLFWRADKGNIPMPIRFVHAEATDTSGGRPLAFILLTMVLGFGASLLVMMATGAVAYVASELGSLTELTAQLNAGRTPPLLIVVGSISQVVSTLPVAIAALILWGKGWRERLRSCLRGARWPDYAIAIAAPLALYLVTRIMSFAYARVVLSMAEDHAPPSISEVFALPAWLSIAYYVVPAFLEEIGWRGYLQTHAVRRFGVARGILLVGVTWALWHIRDDLSGSATFAQAAMVVSNRLIGTTLLGVLMGWLFLRSGSILPVTFWHVVHNSLTSIPPIQNSSTIVPLIGRLLATVALTFVFYCVYPPKGSPSPELADLQEPAVTET